MGQTLLQRLGTLLYIVNPKTSSFEHADDVPNYVDEAVPLFVAFMTLEAIIRKFQGKNVRVNASICSFGIGILHEATVFLSATLMFFGYQWLYKFRILDLPWDSLYTWFGAFIFIDFCYYWIHRANHEVNLLWAAHQVHHSSEDYNLTIALRLSIFQRAASFGFYQPLAIIGFPFSMVIVHAAFNYLFQFWVHTDLIRSLGPLEYVIMSPSHHRVHHGSNKWCLDKNYASVFVLWDRLFGTFEAEKKDEEIVYGLTDQPQTHNAVYMEFFYFKHLYQKARSMTTWKDSLKAIFYGPGWSPGTPRLGDPATFPDIKAPRQKYDPPVSLWLALYLIIHTGFIFLGQQTLLHYLPAASWVTIVLALFCIFLSVAVTGGLIDNSWWAAPMEAVRCAAYVTYAYSRPVTGIPIIDSIVLTCFAASMLIWTVHSVQHLSTTWKPSQKLSKLE
ncbi:alkylglycerol monooxygenase-like isoform X1 [Macrobrachium nipponense]|uniref:alkylglycerol monooxygenase-like isoform X1 n=3 Tax=Macrobrachium nipponense TaxID=159736 RepID=UPI0030C7BAD9